MKAINVSRVSTEEQREAGNSLPAQIERIESYCKNKSFEVVKAFSFDESAYKDKRDEFDKLLEYVQLIAKKEKIAVCFDKVDRLSRSVFDKRVGTLYEMAVADKIEIHFVSDGQVINNQMSAVEKFQFGMSLGLAKYYSDAISDNVKRAFEQKLRKGEWIGQAPIGYLNTIDDKDKKTVTTDNEKAHFVVKIFQLYATGNYSLKLISKEMKQAGLVGLSGKDVSTSQIERILKNPFYYGEMQVEGNLYQHNYEPLISKHLFLQCKKVRESYHKKPFQYSAKPFIFRGLLTCDNCGCLYSPEMKKGKHVYYSCTNGKGVCKKVYINEKELLEPIFGLIRQLQLPDEGVNFVVEKLRSTTQVEQEYHNRIVSGLRLEYDRIENRISKMADDKYDGSITTEMYDKKLTEYKSQQQNLIMQMQEHSNADENYHLTASKLLDICKRAVNIFESSEPNEKRQFLNFLLQNCRLRGKDPLFTLKPVFAGIVSAHKSSNWLQLAELFRTIDWKNIQFETDLLQSA